MTNNNDAARISELLFEDMPHEMIEKIKKDLSDLGYQGFLLSISGLGYPKEVVTKVRNLHEYLSHAAQ